MGVYPCLFDLHTTSTWTLCPSMVPSKSNVFNGSRPTWLVDFVASCTTSGFPAKTNFPCSTSTSVGMLSKCLRLCVVMKTETEMSFSSFIKITPGVDTLWKSSSSESEGISAPQLFPIDLWSHGMPSLKTSASSGINLCVWSHTGCRVGPAHPRHCLTFLSIKIHPFSRYCFFVPFNKLCPHCSLANKIKILVWQE